MAQGKVKWFNQKKGYGFIQTETSNRDLFVHYTEIQKTGKFASLNEGQNVEFEIVDGEKGPCAKNVRKLV